MSNIDSGESSGETGESRSLLAELLNKPVEVWSIGQDDDHHDEGVLVAFDRSLLKLRGEDLLGRPYHLYLNRSRVRLIKWKEK